MEVGKELGPEADLEVALEDGKIKLSAVYDGKGGGAEVSMYARPAYLVDKLTDVIPGDMDDAILDSWAEKLLAKKTGK